MEIKEYADRIREEISIVNSKIDELLNNYDKCKATDAFTGRVLTKYESYRDGLNTALDIYLDLVKEDL